MAPPSDNFSLAARKGTNRPLFELNPDFPRSRQGHITNQRVADVLNNPLYTGHICSETYELDWLKGQHEPLISIDTYDKVQDRLNTIPKNRVRKNVGNDFALRGFVTCGDCGSLLRSSWSKGRDRAYAYYLCQAKGCASYGKSIPRDNLEGDIGALVKTLQPSQKVFDVFKAMFRDVWDQRQVQAEEMAESAKQQVTHLEKKADTLLVRLMEVTNPTVISAYEGKLSALEREKTKLQDQMVHHNAPKSGTFSEKLEPALQFLANLWKLWESGQITLQRMVLKLAFADRITYHRNEGARTAKIALPFKALSRFLYKESSNGAANRTNLEPQSISALLEELESWEALLRSEPEVLATLNDLERAATKQTSQAKILASTAPARRGPSL